MNNAHSKFSDIAIFSFIAIPLIAPIIYFMMHPHPIEKRQSNGNNPCHCECRCKE